MARQFQASEVLSECLQPPPPPPPTYALNTSLPCCWTPGSSQDFSFSQEENIIICFCFVFYDWLRGRQARPDSVVALN